MIDDPDWVGSQALADALAAVDVDGIGRALRMDVVLVPRLEVDDQGSQIRVFPSPDPQRPYRLFLFSTTASFRLFLEQDDSQRSFDLVPGRALATFLDANAAVLELVVFDPAGPHALSASPRDVRASLTPQPTDDEVGWITDGPGEPTGTPPGAAIDMSGFTVVDPRDEVETARVVQVLVGRYVDFMKRRQRPAVRAWADDVVARTRGRETELGLLVLGGPARATLLAAWPEWHRGDGVIDRVAADARSRGEAVDEFEGAAGRILRHRHEDAASQLVDHWVPVGGWTLLLRFSSAIGAGHEDAVLEVALRMAQGVVFVA